MKKAPHAGSGCILCFLLVFHWAGAAGADDLESGVEAYQQGDYQTAIDAWMPLAETGNVDALFNMGQLYRMGRGVPKDPVMAEYFYRQAAGKGHLAAQGNLGTLYYFGFEDSPRVKPALEWWRKAARAGDARSQYMLGLLYYNGAHIGRDPVRAYAWIRKAAVAGLPEAVEAEEKLIRALSVKELAAGNNLSARVQDLPIEVQDGAPMQDQAPAAPTASPPEPQPEAEPEARSPSPDDPAQKENLTPDDVSGFYVQLAALGTRRAAEALRDRLSADMAALVLDMNFRIEAATLDDGRQVHRLLLGGFTSRAAAALRCAAFKEEGRDCFVVKR